MEMKTYACVVKPAKNPLHEIKIDCATKQELQLLAFIHGVDAIPVDRIRPLGLKRVACAAHRDEATGEPVIRYVESEMDEYRRLVGKYETRVNPGKGKQYVEECFKVKIDGFDHLLGEVDALSAMEAATAKADQADAEKAIAVGAEARKATAERAQADAEKPSIGNRVFANLGAGS